jgi:hypothetical protein
VNLPRYRTLDGDEVELPLAMDRWVLVPRTLARFDPELAWTLDYEDAPEPDDADARLDFSGGALLVPVERWNEHAALEPNLAPCRIVASFAAATDTPPPGLVSTVAPNSRDEDERPTVGGSVDRIVARAATTALATLALGYVVAVAAWLWSLRHQISGPERQDGPAPRRRGDSAGLAGRGGGRRTRSTVAHLTALARRERSRRQRLPPAPNTPSPSCASAWPFNSPASSRSSPSAELLRLVTSSSVLRRSPPPRDARPALLAVAIAHQARIAAERAATAREARRARAARRAAHAVACALDALERLVLADRTAELAAASRNNPLYVAGTVTPRRARMGARLAPARRNGSPPQWRVRWWSPDVRRARERRRRDAHASSAGRAQASCPGGAPARAPC